MQGLYKIPYALSTEITPFHSVSFEIVTTLTLTDAEFAAIWNGINKIRTIHAGEILYSNIERITDDPKIGVTLTGVEAIGVLSHDINLVYGKLTYEVGVAINAVVYQDVIEHLHGHALTDALKQKLKSIGIKIYNVKTLKA